MKKSMSLLLVFSIALVLLLTGYESVGNASAKNNTVSSGGSSNSASSTNGLDKFRGGHPFMNRSITPQDFGAKGDGQTDDTQALKKWLAALSITRSGYIPAGNYLFNTTLKKAGDGITIRGEGYASILTYVGANTTVDLIDFGDGINNQNNWTLSGFRVTSNTEYDRRCRTALAPIFGFLRARCDRGRYGRQPQLVAWLLVRRCT